MEISPACFGSQALSMCLMNQTILFSIVMENHCSADAHREASNLSTSQLYPGKQGFMSFIKVATNLNSS